MAKRPGNDASADYLTQRADETDAEYEARIAKHDRNVSERPDPELEFLVMREILMQQYPHEYNGIRERLVNERDGAERLPNESDPEFATRVARERAKRAA